MIELVVSIEGYDVRIECEYYDLDMYIRSIKKTLRDILRPEVPYVKPCKTNTDDDIPF